MEVSELDDLVIRVHQASVVAESTSKSLSDLATNWAAGIVKSSRQMAIAARRCSTALDELRQHLQTIETDLAALESDES